jgi:kumamolisin
LTGRPTTRTAIANSADGEVMLDIDVIGGIAPRCRQRVYFAPNTDAGFLDAIAAALSSRPDAISISWGAPETAWTGQGTAAMEALFAHCVAAGDAGVLRVRRQRLNRRHKR